MAIVGSTRLSIPVQVKAWNKKATAFVNAFAREFIREFGSRVIRRTPVDTGQAMGNYQTTVDGNASGPVARYGGTYSLTALKRATEGALVGHVINFENMLPYIRRLEYGWSKQAPAGMMRLTATETGSIAKLAATRAAKAMGGAVT